METSRRRPRFNRGCLVRALVAGLFVLVAAAMLILAVLVYSYYSIARTLPSVTDLRSRASQFETARIYDREGRQIYELVDPNAGRRTYVPLAKISPYLLAATIATEDKDFYDHPGFDPVAIVRALWQNMTSGEVVSGASTITQQLARALLLTPEERADQSYNRKIREVILAAEITRQYRKDEILELYLNEIYYGTATITSTGPPSWRSPNRRRSTTSTQTVRRRCIASAKCCC
jgi:membrane peptidoglycan carboxypeptidase